jgi:hypothetical protein
MQLIRAERPAITGTVEKTKSQTTAALLLSGVGISLLALLIALVALYVNVPSGLTISPGLSLKSVSLFRAHWGYPVFVLSAQNFATLAAILISSLFLTYFAGAWVISPAKRWQSRNLAVSVIVLFAIASNAVLALAMPPVLSTDIYHYVLVGRILTFYKLNPYLAPVSQFVTDPTFAYGFWTTPTTHYGPVWTLISGAVVFLAGHDLTVSVIAFKVTAALFNLANCALVFFLARRIVGPAAVIALLLYAWNPLILIETAGSGHTDAAMMTFALLGLLLIMRGRLLVGIGIMTASVLMKYVTGLLLLFTIVYFLGKEQGWRRRLLLAMRISGVVLVVTATLCWLCRIPASALAQLASVQGRFDSLARMFLSWVIGALLNLWLPPDVAQPIAEQAVLWLLYGSFVAVVAILLWKIFKGRTPWQQMLTYSGGATLFYVTAVYSYTFPWFLIPSITLACLRPEAKSRLLGWSMIISICLMLFYALVK